MFLGIRKKYWVYLGATVALMGLTVFVNLSPVFAWRHSEASGPYSTRMQKMMDKNSRRDINVFRFDKECLLDSALAIREIEKLRLRLILPDGIKAEVNRFQPVALVYAGNGRLSGIDRNCRLIPYDQDWGNIDLPILSGLKSAGLFTAPEDYRVAEVVKGLIRAQADLPELCARIAEIDFSRKVCLTIYLTCSQKRFRAVSDGFFEQLVRLQIVGGVDAWDEAGCYNLIYPGMVIKE